MHNAFLYDAVMMLINWYPGHMAKTRRILEANLKLIDVVIEILDARAPMSSRNVDFDGLFSPKKRVVVLNKADLADPNETKKWIARFAAEGIAAIPCVATKSGSPKYEINLITGAVQAEIARKRERGIAKTVRALVAGIPNVGKSTFINRIAAGAVTKTGDKPGVTLGRQWVRISPYLELLDTPGLLWPKLDNQPTVGTVSSAQKLAFIGCVKDDILDIEALAQALLAFLLAKTPQALIKRYTKITPETDQTQLLEAVAQSRGFILKGGVYDIERAANIVMDEFRAGKIVKITLDECPV